MNDCYLSLLLNFRALLSIDSGANLVNSKQAIGVNLYKEYSYLILNKLEGLPCFGVMIWQPF